MDEINDVLEPLAEDRRRLIAILDLIEKSEDDIVRADLASELVGACSRYEDVMERVVYPALERLEVEPRVIDRGEDERDAVRDSLVEIRKRTLHVKPAYVHWEDPEGFDAALEHLVVLIRDHLEHDDLVLVPALAGLDATERAELRSEVEHGVKHASTYPNPPQNLLARGVVAVIEKLERGLHDESTPWHPGVDLLDAALPGGDPAGKR
jgi:hypothetical protein